MVQGRFGIAVFALVTGYVCALKPIRQSKAGNIEGALSSIAKSAFRRIPRLALPATFATVVIFFLAQLGAFEIARHSDSIWLTQTIPKRQETMSAALYALFQQIVMTWSRNLNAYDPNQWTLLPLLKGSMQMFITLAGTIYMSQGWRMRTSFAFYCWYFISGEGMHLPSPKPLVRHLAGAH
jgi:hypothetical protein